MLKLNPKAFLPVVIGIAAALKYAIDSHIVPVEYAGWAAMAASLLNGVLQQSKDTSPALPGFGDEPKS